MLYITFLIITIVWLLFACITDLKTREVPNWLNYSLIAIGLGGRLIYSLINSQFSFFLYGLFGFGIFFIISSIMYYTKQWGGGDGKLLMGLGAMYGDYENVLNTNLYFPFLIEFLINLAVVGALFGLLWSIVLGFKKRNKLKEEILNNKFKKQVIILALVFIFSIIPSFFIKELYIFIFVIPILFLILFFIQAVDKCCMYKYLKPENLTEGDWIAEDVKINGKLIVGTKDLYITKKQIEILKSSKIRKVLVKDGIPFVPAFLIAFVITLVIGNLALYFF